MNAIKKWLASSSMIAVLASGYLFIDSGFTTQKASAEETPKIWAYGSEMFYKKPDGSLYGWGANVYQQLGVSTSVAVVHTPTQVTDPTVFGTVALSGTNNTTLGLQADGTVYAWGGNAFGVAGNGNLAVQKTPAKVQTPTGGSLSSIISLHTGVHSAYAIDTSGNVWSWGGNYTRQLGLPTAADTVLKATQIPNVTGVSAVAGGSDHALALKTDGTVWGWGSNIKGELGIGTADTATHVPVQVKSSSTEMLSHVKQLTAGNYTSFALKDDGSVYSWGLNEVNSLGDGTLIDHYYPAPVKTTAGTSLTDVAQIDTSNTSSLALKKDGTVWAWGTLATSKYSVATKLDGLSDIVAIDQGNIFAVAMKRDGTLYIWGSNTDVGVSSATPTPVANLFYMNASAQTISSNEIDVAFSGTGSTVDHFTVSRNPGMETASTQTSPYKDTTATPGTTYTYTVTAYDASAKVLGSKQVSATASVDVDLKATLLDVQSAKIEYSANGTVSNWKVLRNGMEINVASGASDVGLAPNTTYTYTVEAYNETGLKIGSSTKTVTTAPPAEVVQISATATATSSNSIDITFGAMTGTVDHYKVYRLPDLTEVAVLNGSKAVDTNLNSSTTYSYKVIAYNNAGAEIGNSVVVSAKTFGQVSLAVTPVATSPNTTRIEYTVTGNTADVDHYVVTRAGQTQPIYTGTALTTTDSGLTPETTYSYTVTAYDAAGHVIGQGVGTVKTPAVVAVPFDMTVYQQQTPPNQVKLTFVPNRTVAKYVVNKNGQKVYEGAQSEFTDTSLVAGPYYQYEIIAYDAEGKELGRKSGYVSIGNNGNTNPNYPYPGYPTPGYPAPGMPYPGPMYYYPITITVTVGIPYPAPMYNPYPYPQYPVPQYPYPQQQYPYPQYPQYPPYPTPQYPQYPQYPNTQYPQFPQYPQQTLQSPQQVQYPQFTQYPQVQSLPAA